MRINFTSCQGRTTARATATKRDGGKHPAIFTLRPSTWLHTPSAAPKATKAAPPGAASSLQAVSRRPSFKDPSASSLSVLPAIAAAPDLSLPPSSSIRSLKDLDQPLLSPHPLQGTLTLPITSYLSDDAPSSSFGTVEEASDVSCLSPQQSWSADSASPALCQAGFTVDSASAVPQPLIPGLPDELAMECLLRLPRSDHKNSRAVSKLWRESVQSDLFYRMRKERGLRQGWLYVLLRDSSDTMTWHTLDPNIEKWHSVPEMPGSSGRTYGSCCVACDGRLYVIGGGTRYRPSKQDVWCYTPHDTEWRHVADLNTGRCYCSGGEVDGKVYVAGGMGRETPSLESAEVYDPEEDSWQYIRSMPEEFDIDNSAVVEGKLLIRRAQHDAAGPFVIRYDPGEDCWWPEMSRMCTDWQGPSAVVDGQIYMLLQDAAKLMKFDRKGNNWVPVGTLPSGILSTPCKLIGYKRHLYIVGKGANVVVLNLEVIPQAPSADELPVRVIKANSSPSDIVVGIAIVEV